uniref:PH domain containing endocytic trafficking adaptor 1 n=1 Tax=Calidris pygmaea TaxID=425635 RepID=A0A8C3KPZ2_9CHAR
MKLNERSLAFYATCDSPADNAGFLYKRGERHTAYHRRWFVLKGNMLFYFEERESREPVGVIVLEGCTVELCDSAEEFAFAIRFGGTKSLNGRASTFCGEKSGRGQAGARWGRVGGWARRAVPSQSRF